MHAFQIMHSTAALPAIVDTEVLPVTLIFNRRARHSPRLLSTWTMVDTREHRWGNLDSIATIRPGDQGLLVSLWTNRVNWLQCQHAGSAPITVPFTSLRLSPPRHPALAISFSSSYRAYSWSTSSHHRYTQTNLFFLFFSFFFFFFLRRKFSFPTNRGTS